jgi:pimeloyl-ACP methyl ester carboxylesterase
MKIHDAGSGLPLVIVSGIQGRWEWMRPGIEELSRRYRVVTFSLCDEPSSGGTFDEARGFFTYVDQVASVVSTLGLRDVIVCGVSYGGLIAASFAARHPDQVSALVLLSALPPSWRINARARFYLQAPRLLFPLFALSSLRLMREMVAAHDGLAGGLAAAVRHGWNVLTHPASPARMARRVRLLEGLDLADELRRLTVPTLAVTGEEHLDYVVPPASTREYLRLWPHARGGVLSKTGHLGVITRPDELSRMLDSFLADVPGVSSERRRIG